MVGMLSQAVLLSCFLPVLLFDDDDRPKITFATYNLWNIMFNWDVRKYRIAQMIREVDADVVGFQEVRADHSRSGRNQMEQLQRLVPRYKWYHFEAASDIYYPNDVYLHGWEKEGLGILSKHPIIKAHVQSLAYQKGPDTNRRIVLHASISIKNVGTINVAVTHFSYDMHQQCGNAAELLSYIHRLKLKNVVMMGDFNTFNHFEAPMRLLTGHFQDNEEVETTGFKVDKCPPYTLGMFADPDSEFVGVFMDAWNLHREPEDGNTFSNMPDPGLESRPDRILVSHRFEIRKSKLLGNGQVYKEKFYSSLVWSRFRTMVSAAGDALAGKRGVSCQYDCGPHASCRCGVCVGGTGHYPCDVEDCEECSVTLYRYFALIVLAAIFLLFQLIYAFLRIFHAMNQNHRQTVMQFVGAPCCICNPALYKPTSKMYRDSVLFIPCRLLPWCYLPPLVLVGLTLIKMILLLQIIYFLYDKSLKSLYSIIPEELFPSDHLMLAVTVKVSDFPE